MRLGSKEISSSSETYFIAEIGSNFDGDKERAIDLIHLAKDIGADAAKFQHYTAASLVSDVGFSRLANNSTHQSGWTKSVFETYEDASLTLEWTPLLAEECKKVGIDFMTSPYSFDLIDAVDEFVESFKIGSGDITWHDAILRMASKGKPILLATGASSLEEVRLIMDKIQELHSQTVLMQCTTDYSGSLDHFKYSNLNVLKTYAVEFPDVVLGLSDHTPGYVTTLGAVVLGAKVIEKHFTDDCNRSGPDHKFALDSRGFAEMINRTRELEQALGSEEKAVEENEIHTRVVQRRAIRAKRKIDVGEILAEEDFTYLRPCPEKALEPYRKTELIGRTVKREIGFEEEITFDSCE